MIITLAIPCMELGGRVQSPRAIKGCLMDQSMEGYIGNHDELVELPEAMA